MVVNVFMNCLHGRVPHSNCVDMGMLIVESGLLSVYGLLMFYCKHSEVLDLRVSQWLRRVL